MGRKPKKKELVVWMNGERVGIWTVTAQGGHEFRYAGVWKDSPAVRPLSLSMPLRSENVPYWGDVVEFYFDNLLPNSVNIRKRVQSRFGISTSKPFDLLREIGRDCVGAVQLLPEGEQPPEIRQIIGEPLSEQEIEGILVHATSGEGFPEDSRDFRISIAGAQEKTALLRHKNTWHRPVGATPTTHIFKLPIGIIGIGNIDLTTSIENEWLCLELVQACGLDAAAAKIQQFGSQKVLVVKRFDRQPSANGSWIIRIPQEDMCQAFGLSPGMKYESEGGPGIQEIMDLLIGAKNSEQDRKTFFKTQIVLWLLAAIDGHAKNFSVFIEPKGRFSLTPIYDVLSAYPVLGNTADRLRKEKIKMAMAVYGKNKHYKWSRIRHDHWYRTGELCGLSKRVITEVFNEIIDAVPKAVGSIATKLPPDFPSSVADPILDGFGAAVRLLE